MPANRSYVERRAAEHRRDRWQLLIGSARRRVMLVAAAVLVPLADKVRAALNLDLWSCRTRLHQLVDVCGPGVDRQRAGPLGGHVAVLRDLAPAASGRSGGPVRHDVLGARV